MTLAGSLFPSRAANALVTATGERGGAYRSHSPTSRHAHPGSDPRRATPRAPLWPRICWRLRPNLSLRRR